MTLPEIQNSLKSQSKNMKIMNFEINSLPGLSKVTSNHEFKYDIGIIQSKIIWLIQTVNFK